MKRAAVSLGTTAFRTAPLRPVQRRSGAVVDALLQMIAARGLKPGEALPRERELAEEFEVSRNVLREAFGILEERGLISARRGSGRYLRDVSNDREALPVLPAMEVASIADTLETRILLEERVAVLACQRRTLAEAQQIRTLARRLVVWEDNLNFHVALGAATHNFMLERILRQQIELLGELGQRRHYRVLGEIDRARQEHLQIAEAVAARDEGRAAYLVREHLQRTRTTVMGEAGRETSQVVGARGSRRATRSTR